MRKLTYREFWLVAIFFPILFPFAAVVLYGDLYIFPGLVMQIFATN
jgi:hypothetical protein